MIGYWFSFDREIKLHKLWLHNLRLLVTGHIAQTLVVQLKMTGYFKLHKLWLHNLRLLVTGSPLAEGF